MSQKFIGSQKTQSFLKQENKLRKLKGVWECLFEVVYDLSTFWESNKLLLSVWVKCLWLSGKAINSFLRSQKILTS